MVRNATKESSAELANGEIKRTLRLQLDEEGVLRLDEELLARLRDGDALGLPGRFPTCESCWTETAVAIVLCPGEVAMFRGTDCVAAAGLRADARLVPIVSS